MKTSPKLPPDSACSGRVCVCVQGGAGTEARIPSAPWQAFRPVFCRQEGWRGRMQSKGVKRWSCKNRCALINSSNKYFRGCRHCAPKNAEQQALWRPPRAKWTGVGVGQRPRWLSRALAAEIAHLLGSISSLKEEVPAVCSPSSCSSQGLVRRILPLAGESSTSPRRGTHGGFETSTLGSWSVVSWAQETG